MIAHDVVGDGPRTAVLLHGILGSRQNLLGLAKRVVEADARWSCVLCDLRGHGASHDERPPHTIAACVDDVVAAVSSRGRAVDAVVGHSFGGKVALAIAAAQPAKACVALDAPPGARPGFLVDGGRGEDVARVLATVRAVPTPIASRKALVEQLRGAGLSDGVAQWMTTNLRPVDAGGGAPAAADARGPSVEGGFVWKPDFAVVDALLADFAVVDLWPAIEQTIAARVVLVRGGRSDRWSPDERARVAQAVADGLVDEVVIEGAGHWVHTDAVDDVVRIVVDVLGRAA